MLVRVRKKGAALPPPPFGGLLRWVITWPIGLQDRNLSRQHIMRAGDARPAYALIGNPMKGMNCTAAKRCEAVSGEGNTLRPLLATMGLVTIADAEFPASSPLVYAFELLRSRIWLQRNLDWRRR